MHDPKANAKIFSVIKKKMIKSNDNVSSSLIQKILDKAKEKEDDFNKLGYGRKKSN